MKLSDIGRWRVELENAEKFRDDEFGILQRDEKSKAGENLDYYERGYFNVLKGEVAADDDAGVTTVNLVDAITSIIVPSLYFQNPRTICTPRRPEDADTAPIVGKIIDYYRKVLGVEEINKKIIWDAYVFGYGVDKLGYTTKFGMDIEDEGIDKNNKKKMIDRIAETIGLKKKEPQEPERKEINYRILSENPFLTYVSPFNFGMDFRATMFEDTLYRYHKIRKAIESMKDNKKYKNTADLKGQPPDDILSIDKVPESQLEAFETVDLYEVHYRNDGKWYLLVISKDGSNSWRYHYHEESIYTLGDWQLDILAFKKHGHKLYPISDISKVKNLQDRITDTVDDILDQVNKFVPKIVYKTGSLTKQGINSLKFGGIGALVETNDDVDKTIKELGFTQLKADLVALIDQLIGLITIQTGLTRAQLTGISDAGTATEATIEQGGQNIRNSDMSKSVRSFVNRQSTRLFKVIKQFVTLEELNIINGVKGVDEQGIPLYNWLSVSPDQAAKIREGEYDFDIEVGSTEKVNLAVVRKAFENLFNILARTDVLVAIQEQGNKVDLGEILRRYFDLFPELSMDSAKIIQKIQSPTGGLVVPQQSRGGTTTGSQANEMAAQRGEGVPTAPGAINEIY